ncbi:hydrogenase nickel incorporation protein HypB [Streptomyces scopuliridis]|uniref:Hydrogenase nickel incorporation protein HypB n=1 Tax=Streptomyces scopuliridis TaxID=452529 RepID=A0ACD4ZVN7_9ACTN|nr:hydrogenase nickel incorporation protein HypB [Streptomyces scopuliridis]WSB38117.1 hydrogenase nickel incorporation protein HypB [Streptomyces scopuliridis]WSC02550.1 hydrogenase nickel incorporation protein HypB [Streptomyces scopuliridis]WSC03918.1 hydrogenase nickel incorporation protein HypB [Streptomyces scopuliridis]
MCRVVDLRQAVLAKNDACAVELREHLAARGTAEVNLLSSPGSGKTALLELLLARAVAGGVTVAAVTADLATENDARRLARAGAPVQQVLTDGLCHLEAGMLRERLDGWLPRDTRVLFVENVGNLVCPASYDLGESLRIVLGSVTEGEDKPLKYPTAFGLAHLVVITKTDIAEAVEFDAAAFHRNVRQVNPGVPVLETSARTGAGVDELLALILGVADGAPVHRPVLARQHERYLHHHHGDEDGHTHDGGEDGHSHEHPAAAPIPVPGAADAT